MIGEGSKSRQVRCPQCGRLLAMQQANGEIEIRTGRQVIVTERALLSCSKCGTMTRAGKWPRKKGVDRNEGNG